MAKKTNGLPKAKIEKLLAQKGLKMWRETHKGNRVWHVSNGHAGRDYNSLQAVVRALKLEV